eukprot:NODE_1915_length_1036_cov_71.012158_g1557_i0.p1 GENE.NODE_1915_length_1036_cov_71.012158_g1557_i0~~NODE_1915_length_1036_cov_71.012158_g1557_i0.p1  ORF type:complete len:162 (-),score=13.40 NODE_1915_length_1036_cov_71.012158_g1557_i0:189-674(-)
MDGWRLWKVGSPQRIFQLRPFQNVLKASFTQWEPAEWRTNRHCKNVCKLKKTVNVFENKFNCTAVVLDRLWVPCYQVLDYVICGGQLQVLPAELLEELTGQADEWMYELKEAEKNDPNFLNNKAWLHIAKRDKTVAKSYLESIDSDTPNTLRMRRALNAKC